LIAEIVRVEKDGGKISRDEIVSMVFLLLFAGHETTTHLISGSTLRAAEESGLRDWLREDWHPARSRGRGISALHHAGAVHQAALCTPRCRPRRHHREEGRQGHADVGGRHMDPLANAHPERLDLQRKPNRHIAFGTGIHFCLGHQLARIEGRCALKSLLRRWPELALAVDPSEIKWRKRPGLRAIDRLPVVAGAASTRAERDEARVA
jgi:cytochrome P450 PksS